MTTITKDNKELVSKLSDAVRCTFSNCIDTSEYHIAKVAIVEFMSALGIDGDDASEILSLASGVDSQADDCIDELIAALYEDSED